MAVNESVKIDAIRVRELVLPFRIPFRISQGVLLARRSLIVEMESDGVVGYGESAPGDEPFYSEETLGTVRTIYEELFLPRLIGKEFATVDDFDVKLRRGVRGNPFARAGLENAYWDLVCRRNEVSLVDLIAERLKRLGLPSDQCVPSARIPSGVSIGIPEDRNEATLQSWIEEFLDEGYQRVKIKISPGWDLGACRTARSTVGEGFPLWTDANSSFELSEHLDIYRAMDEFEMLFHEQPLDHCDLLDHARLAKEINTPLCLDESLKDARSGRQALELSASKIWNIKVQRIGGLCEALRIYSLAVENDVALWGGTMPESGIGSQVILALSAFPAFAYAADVEASDRWYQPGYDPVEIVMDREGTIALPSCAGVAEAIDFDRYERHSCEVLRR
ncbi:MAG: o-succinylbenzoate synthase [Pirellulales bacterium]